MNPWAAAPAAVPTLMAPSPRMMVRRDNPVGLTPMPISPLC
jgi:hypothetical protein